MAMTSRFELSMVPSFGDGCVKNTHRKPQGGAAISSPRATTTLSSRPDVVAGCFSSLGSDPLVMTATDAFQGGARGLFLSAAVAQLAEHGSSTSVVAGSTPVGRSSHSHTPSNAAAAIATAARLVARRISRRTAVLAQVWSSFSFGMSPVSFFARLASLRTDPNLSEGA